MDVTIVNQPDLRIAGIRHIGPYQEIGREFGRLGGLLKGPPPAGSQMIALYHDDPEVTPSDRLRSDAALSLPGKAPSPSGLIEQHIPAGRYAKAIHKGGYEGLPAAWAALKNEWLPKSGHKMGHPSYEIYLNNPMTTEKAELLTEIYLRLGD
jgi:AraC family transcriptional regulator